MTDGQALRLLEQALDRGLVALVQRVQSDSLVDVQHRIIAPGKRRGDVIPEHFIFRMIDNPNCPLAAHAGKRRPIAGVLHQQELILRAGLVHEVFPCR